MPDHSVKLVMTLYADSKTRLKVAEGLSKEFPISVHVHQGSAISQFLFLLMTDEVTKECRENETWETLCADNLVLTEEPQEEADHKFMKGRQAMAKRGIKVNVAKKKVMVTGKNAEDVSSSRYPCAVCCKGVGKKYILCTVCGSWCHNR